MIIMAPGNKKLKVAAPGGDGMLTKEESLQLIRPALATDLLQEGIQHTLQKLWQSNLPEQVLPLGSQTCLKCPELLDAAGHPDNQGTGSWTGRRRLLQWWRRRPAAERCFLLAWKDHQLLQLMAVWLADLGSKTYWEPSKRLAQSVGVVLRAYAYVHRLSKPLPRTWAPCYGWCRTSAWTRAGCRCVACQSGTSTSRSTRAAPGMLFCLAPARVWV